jgi:uncharacterized protein YcbK (DUF882 family)
MMPILTIAFALLSNAVDLARLFVPAPQAPAPITFYFQNRHEEQSFALLDDNGDVRADMMKPFSHFVRCWRTERVKPMYPRTIEIVAAISQHFGDARVEIISGYRAKPYGAPHSKHFIGHAMDIMVDGVPAKQVAAWVWKNFRHVGVGYYPKQEFVHVDARDDDVRWIDMATHGESAKARYFGRLATDELPADAPVLAFDRAKAAPVAAVAQVSKPLPSAMAASTIAAILE